MIPQTRKLARFSDSAIDLAWMLQHTSLVAVAHPEPGESVTTHIAVTREELAEEITYRKVTNMMTNLRALRWIVQNFPTQGDPVLEETRRTAIAELEELVLNAAKLPDRRKAKQGSEAIEAFQNMVNESRTAAVQA